MEKKETRKGLKAWLKGPPSKKEALSSNHSTANFPPQKNQINKNSPSGRPFQNWLLLLFKLHLLTHLTSTDP
jgi:hypothetical protein